MDIDTLTTTRNDPSIMVTYILIYLASFSSAFFFSFYAGRTCHTAIIPSQSFRIVIHITVIIKFPPDPVAGLGVAAQYSLFIASMCIIYDALGYSLARRLFGRGFVARSV
ncbi:hypothetical protein M405DRAFT_606606 [Rhizopogon salebrosus TDB-379]|jgi:hypothetical protein|nr:hypothetical protein M405DRAFT_606606 [Rhizopogon salebrosus TDB-379]